ARGGPGGRLRQARLWGGVPCSARPCSVTASPARAHGAPERGVRARCRDGPQHPPMTTLNGEHVTPERLMSRELSFSCGAVVPAAKRGAVVPTPKWTAGV